MRKICKGIVWGICFLIFQWAMVNVSAYELRLTFSEITQTANLIFVGTATKETPRANEQNNMIFTDVTFDDLSVVHGTTNSIQKDSEKIILTYAGGDLGGYRVAVSGTPKFQIGHRYLIFMFDDGKTYANPIVGGYQGLFEVVKDVDTGESYLLTSGGKAVIGVDNTQVTVSEYIVSEIRNGRIITSELDRKRLERFYPIPPSTDHPESSAELSPSKNNDQQQPLKLQDFIHYIKNVALKAPISSPKIKSNREGFFFQKKGEKLELKELKGPDSFLFKEQGEVDSKQLPWDLNTPEAGNNSNLTDVSSGICKELSRGGTMGACGYHDLYLVMEQVPTSWWSYSTNDNCMGAWNQFMDIYRYSVDDGTFGNNSQNEFCGFVSDATLYSTYGYHWGSGIACCITWMGFLQPTCGEIVQSDICWNSAYNWTNDADFAIGNPNVLLLRPINMHELGHSWGEQRGIYVETYDYDVPTVMHAYYSSIVEDGWGVHGGDAYLIRRIYDGQTSILNTKDVGVESYYANNGLHNSTTNASAYDVGSSITLRDVTIENMSYSSVSDLRIRFFLSSNNIITTSDYQIGSYWYWSSFPGESYSVSDYTSTIPTGVPPGKYYVGIIVTVDGFGNDDYSYNNSTYFINKITILDTTQPDLIVTAVSGPSSIEAGESCQVDNTIKNQGAVPTSLWGSFDVGIYLSTDATITTSDIRVGQRIVSSLGAGSSSSASTTVNIPSDLSSGTYYWGAIVDSGEFIPESNNDNNTKLGNQTSTNHDPQLTSGNVGPSSGTTSTTFTYTVNYYDQDGDSPSKKYVYIDGSSYTMSLYSGSVSNGTYRYQTTLSAGSHNYYFYFTDGEGGSDKLPSSGNYSGPTVSTTNNPPEKPGAVSPYDTQTNVSLEPTLKGSSYFDLEGDYHYATHWQITKKSVKNKDITNTDIVFEEYDFLHREKLKIPKGILKAGETYYWRLRYSDLYGWWSYWSDEAKFTTIPLSQTDDTDGNGIPDDQQIDGYVDMDGDDTDDNQQDDIATLQNVVSGVKTAVKTDTGIVTQAETQNVNDLPDKPQGYDFPDGVFTFRIEGLTPGSRIEVTFYLSETFTADDEWYKYNEIHGWQDYTNRIVRGIGTNIVTLEFKDGDYGSDGGYGDCDGTKNGAIIDPGGPAKLDEGSSGPYCGDGICNGAETCSSCPGDCGSCGNGGDGGGGGGGGGGCFIATACYGTPMADEVRILNRFRDECLLTNPVGKVFVSAYYEISPPVADFIRKNPVLKNVVRGSLKPIVWMAKKVD